ncbi:MAG TPA: Uma2 family endonuclease [Bacillales bacterium]|nr:Uma2 family endonuclease [Bacillales bacterium]
MAIPQQSKRYSYADYLSWDNDVLCEVIGGVIISMSPSPTPLHQNIITELTTEFGLFLRDKKCVAFPAPIDVCLFANKQTKDNDIKDWVQPDLIVVCDESKIGEKNIIGAPELVIEVLSPSTAKNDRLIKYNSYEKAGVKEYWIVDPYNQTIEVYLLEGKTFVRNSVYFKDDILPVQLFEDLQIELSNIFRS